MCWNKGRLCWKITNLFYFCHLKKLVRPETFGPYYVYPKTSEYSYDTIWWSALGWNAVKVTILRIKSQENRLVVWLIDITSNFMNPIYFKIPKFRSWSGVMNSKWPHINQQIALRKQRTSNKTTELRHVATFASTIQRKWKNQLKRREMKVEGERELVCV